MLTNQNGRNGSAQSLHSMFKSGEGISFNAVTEKSIPKIEIISSIQENEVQIVGEGGKGSYSYLPDKKEIFKQLRKLKISSKGDWMRTKGLNRTCFHFVTNCEKMLNLIVELKADIIHPDFNIPTNELFENPKINVVAITNKPNTPFYTHSNVNLNRPIPMYVIERKRSEPDSHLGGIASYVLSNPSKNTDSLFLEDIKVIAVMKVVLGGDKVLTIENVVFKNKPAMECMIPILEDVPKPEIPLLEGGKLLKWKCTKCLITTWKFPLNKDSHMCNGCLICNKPFATQIALKKHLFVSILFDHS